MLIRLRLDPRLLEEVVHLELRRREAAGDAGPAESYHRQADALYEVPRERREPEFAALHRRLFRELGFEARITEAISAHRPALGGLESLTCLRALRPDDEGADLAPPADGAPGRAAVIRMNAARVVVPEALARLLDRELMHVGDLLSPTFAHDPDSLATIPPHRRRLVQERYRALWAASVDGRLARRGRLPMADPGEHRDGLGRCFPALVGAQVDQLLGQVWREDRPTHAGLLALAAGRGAREPHQPGAPCPLCAFPTHHWVDTADDTLVHAIRTDVPAWQLEDGLCDRCFEMYEIRSLTEA